VDSQRDNLQKELNALDLGARVTAGFEEGKHVAYLFKSPHSGSVFKHSVPAGTSLSVARALLRQAIRKEVNQITSKA